MERRDQVADAVAASRVLARRYGRRPEEILGACWEGVAQAPPGKHLTGADWFVIKWFHWDRRAMRRVVPASSLVDAPNAFDSEPLAAYAREGPDERQRLEELWAETRPRREGWSMGTRVMLYLFAVEGYTVSEVAEAFGVTKSAVCHRFRSATGGRFAAGGWGRCRAKAGSNP